MKFIRYGKYIGEPADAIDVAGEARNDAARLQFRQIAQRERQQPLEQRASQAHGEF